MATSTSNLGLTLPAVNDAADIAVLNSNFQKIDGKIPAAGAAPAGYGLGTSGAQCDDCNNATVDGFYSLSGGSLKNGPPADTYFWFGSMFVVSRHGQMIEQMAFYENRIAVRANLDGVWTEWEYLNPRMILGIEYRTTERHDGKAVYVQAVSFGALPNAKEKLVSYSSKYGTVGGVLCVYGYTSGGIALPYNSSYANYRLYASTTAVGIETDADKSSQTAIVIVKYCLA